MWHAPKNHPTHPLQARPGVLVTFLLFLVTPLQAQRPGQVVLRGNVVDADSHAPVVGAFVSASPSNQGVLTDSLGRFALPADRAASYPIRITQLGYHALEATMPREAESRAFTVGLKPDPIELEGLTVLAERMADRRRGPFGVATILEQKDLLGVSVGTAYELTRQVLPFAQACTPDEDSLCVSVQGRRRGVSVCFDGRVVPSGSPELQAVDPRALYLVEAYPRVGQVRLYSRGYVARLLAAGQDLPPLAFECVGPGMTIGGPGT